MAVSRKMPRGARRHAATGALDRATRATPSGSSVPQPVWSNRLGPLAPNDADSAREPTRTPAAVVASSGVNLPALSVGDPGVKYMSIARVPVQGPGASPPSG